MSKKVEIPVVSVAELNTENPEHIIYETEELGFAILGGIKLEGLDRLRVTLKIEVINRREYKQFFP